MHEYKIVETHEDPKDNVIEKSNITVKFSLRQVEAEEKQMEKFLRELEGKLLIEQAKITNIEANHAFVKDLTEQQAFTVHMYEEARALVRAILPKIEELKKGIDDSRAEVEEINKQIGVAIPAAALDNVQKDTSTEEKKS